jgi:hypothetical protein
MWKVSLWQCLWEAIRCFLHLQCDIVLYIFPDLILLTFIFCSDSEVLVDKGFSYNGKNLNGRFQLKKIISSILLIQSF